MRYKYNLLQLYYVTIRLLKELHGDLDRSYWLQKINNEKGVRKIMYMCMIDNNKETLCKHIYTKDDEVINNLINENGGIENFLFKWNKELDYFKEELYKTKKINYEEDNYSGN
ncbi:TPA: hypothetical protein RTG63_001721 [Campylobacter jejuni]|nr:hypothetical protein [Campylobacter jejuni]